MPTQRCSHVKPYSTAERHGRQARSHTVGRDVRPRRSAVRGGCNGIQHAAAVRPRTRQSRSKTLPDERAYGRADSAVSSGQPLDSAPHTAPRRREVHNGRDGNYRKTERCSAQEIIGIVDCVIRSDGRRVDCTSHSWRMAERLWLALPALCRRYITAVMRRILDRKRQNKR